MLVVAWGVGSQLISAGAGSSPAPGTRTTPLEHIIIILKENRSFDQYFGLYPGANGATQGQMHDGTWVPLTPPNEPLPNDINHSHASFVLAYNHGLMNGFDLEKGAFDNHGNNLAYTAMTESQIPNYWAYARKYGLGDNMFSDFSGASFGNNMFRVAAQSGREDPSTGGRAIYGLPSGVSRPDPFHWGCDEPADHIVNTKDASGDASDMFPCFNFQALPNILSQYGISWRYYIDQNDTTNAFNSLDAVAKVRYDTALWPHVGRLDQFATDASNGTLPAVSWVFTRNTEHPPATACDGENESVQLVNALMQGPDWSTSALAISWDEWGGLYDHVPPPQVDNVSYGFRVPVLMISPWVKYGPGTNGGYVDSTFYSHASWLKLVEDNWTLPSLTSRDAGANDMMDFFDFTQAPKSTLILTTHQCPAMTKQALKVIRSWSAEDQD